MKPAAENWLKIARIELKAAQVLFDSENYIKSVEHCHAALEKLLKGIITENNKQPQKIHDLLRLASEALIDNLKQDIKDLLTELDNVYMSSRYPDEIEYIQERLDYSRTQKILSKTKEIFSWLEKKLKAN